MNRVTAIMMRYIDQHHPQWETMSFKAGTMGGKLDLLFAGDDPMPLMIYEPKDPTAVPEPGKVTKPTQVKLPVAQTKVPENTAQLQLPPLPVQAPKRVDHVDMLLNLGVVSAVADATSQAVSTPKSRRSKRKKQIWDGYQEDYYQDIRSTVMLFCYCSIMS